MINVPEVKLGIVAVSRDCFPAELSKARLTKLVAAAKKSGLGLIPCSTIIESEADALKALAEMSQKGVNAVVVYLGNFGPEASTTIFIQHFDGPAMVCAAAEESGKDLFKGRGDAFCGMLNVSYNLNLRNLRAHIPESPVGLPEELIPEIKDFVNVARVIIGLSSLKVFAFGPRPQDFFACNAPIKPLYDLGIEVMENSELDLLALFKKSAGAKEIKKIAADMGKELGKGNTYPKMLEQLAQYELTLRTFMEKNLGSMQYGVFANKCWPSFEAAFGFVPCYVNSRLASSGIPAACEVDIYGAVSEYMCQLASGSVATLLDINNTVPRDLVKSAAKLQGVPYEDIFMGFHCGNTACECLQKGCAIKYQLIMNRLMENGKQAVITRGTLEGNLKPGPTTVFRLQSTADCAEIRSYLAEGNVLDIDPQSFGAIGVIGIKNFRRFYRHVLIDGNFPHHAALTFKPAGKALFDAVKLLLGKAPATPLPQGVPYPGENPF